MITHRERMVDSKTGERFTATYWEFQMRAGGYSNSEHPYFMACLENDKGILRVGFYGFTHRVQESLEAYAITRAELTMSWSLFESAARRVLDSDHGSVFPIRNKGYFRNNGEEIQYTTNCGLNYYIRRSELEALLS